MNFWSYPKAFCADAPLVLGGFNYYAGLIDENKKHSRKITAALLSISRTIADLEKEEGKLIRQFIRQSVPMKLSIVVITWSPVLLFRSWLSVARSQ